jgi:hypothetical protein
MGDRADRFWVYDGIQFTVDEICGVRTDDGKLF